MSDNFKIEDGIDVTPINRSVGEASKYPFGDMKAGQSFLVPVDVPANVTDPAEKAQVFKEKARQLSNRLSGATRRFRKHNPSANFAVRTVEGGIRVWRLEDKSDGKAATPAKAAPAPKPKGK